MVINDNDAGVKNNSTPAIHTFSLHGYSGTSPRLES